MRIETCSFCSAPVYPSKGIQFVRNDARVFRFCKSKCHKNFKMKRNPRKLKWTKSFRKAHGKEMTVDSTLNFAARRNVPIKYNRDLVATTLQAIKRVEEIRQRRERVFYRQRMAGNKARSLEEDRKLVEENQHLLPPHERYNFTAAEDDMELDDKLTNEAELVDEEEFDGFDNEDEDNSEEEEVTLPVKIKSRLPKAKHKQKMTVDGGLE